MSLLKLFLDFCILAGFVPLLLFSVGDHRAAEFNQDDFLASPINSYHTRPVTLGMRCDGINSREFYWDILQYGGIWDSNGGPWTTEVWALWFRGRNICNTTDHKVLLKKLNLYGVQENTVEQFHSYLTGRQQNCEVNGTLSVSSFMSRASFLLFLTYMFLKTKSKNNNNNNKWKKMKKIKQVLWSKLLS